MSNSDYYNGGGGGVGDNNRHTPQQQQPYHQDFSQSQPYNHSQQNYGQPPGYSNPHQGYNPQQDHNNYQAQSPHYANYPSQHQGYGPQSPPPPGSNYNHGPGYSPPIINEADSHKSTSYVNPHLNNGSQNVLSPGQSHQYYHTDQDGPRNDNTNIPGNEGERGVGATLVGGAAGGLLAHKSGAGKIATVLGTVAGVAAANILEHKLSHKDEKKHKKGKKDKKLKKEKKLKKHDSKSRSVDSDSSSSSGSDSD